MKQITEQKKPVHRLRPGTIKRGGYFLFSTYCGVDPYRQFVCRRVE
jgi:hypothetical protein